MFFTRIGQRGSLFGLVIVYVAQTRAGVDLHAAQLLRHHPGQPRGGRGDRRGVALDDLRHISLPLALPAIVANALFVFMIAWNEFLFALLFLVEHRDRWTVSLGLSQLAGSIEVPTTVLMAGSVILTLPIMVLFFLASGCWPRA